MNPYDYLIRPTKKLGMVVESKAKEVKQGKGRFTCKLLLLEFEEEYVKTWGRAAFEEELKRYSLTEDEAEQIQKEQEAQREAQRKEKAELRRKALELKERELALREHEKKAQPQPELEKPKPEAPKIDVEPILKELAEKCPEAIVETTETEYIIRAKSSPSKWQPEQLRIWLTTLTNLNAVLSEKENFCWTIPKLL